MCAERDTQALDVTQRQNSHTLNEQLHLIFLFQLAPGKYIL